MRVMWKKAQSGVPQFGWPTADRPWLTSIDCWRRRASSADVRRSTAPQPMLLQARTRTVYVVLSSRPVERVRPCRRRRRSPPRVEVDLVAVDRLAVVVRRRPRGARSGRVAAADVEPADLGRLAGRLRRRPCCRRRRGRRRSRPAAGTSTSCCRRGPVRVYDVPVPTFSHAAAVDRQLVRRDRAAVVVGRGST